MRSKWISCAIAVLFAMISWLEMTPPGLAYSLTPVSTPSMIAALPGFARLFSGQRPKNLGVKEGQLTPCPTSPNCVCSQTPASDAQHAIAPIAYGADPSTAMAKLKQVVQEMERTRIIESTDNYLYAEFETRLMGYVDDVEFYLDSAAPVIHVRSASRLGQSDLGVNRQRVEEIRQRFNAIA